MYCPFAVHGVPIDVLLYMTDAVSLLRFAAEIKLTRAADPGDSLDGMPGMDFA